MRTAPLDHPATWHPTAVWWWARTAREWEVWILKMADEEHQFLAARKAKSLDLLLEIQASSLFFPLRM
jgi:hypothetical protein